MLRFKEERVAIHTEPLSTGGAGIQQPVVSGTRVHGRPDPFHPAQADRAPDSGSASGISFLTDHTELSDESRRRQNPLSSQLRAFAAQLQQTHATLMRQPDATTPPNPHRARNAPERAENTDPRAGILQTMARHPGVTASDLTAMDKTLTEMERTLDPESAARFMILLRTLALQNPDSMKHFRTQIDSLLAMQGALKHGDTASASSTTHLQVATINIEASASAVTLRMAGMEAVVSSLDVRVEAVQGTLSRIQGGTGAWEAELLEVEAAWNVSVEMADPLVLDLAGDGISLRSAEEGVSFDLEGTGTPRQVGFIRNDDAFLYLDRNGNGIADDGRELFGDQEGDASGFAKLARYDTNGDGRIDAQDEVFHRLRLWQDRNGDGINQLDESMTLVDAGITALYLEYETVNQMDASGNVVARKGAFERSDGSRGMTADVLLRMLHT